MSLLDTAFLRRHGLFVLGTLLFLLVFFKNAWVADDAYISFRSIEQVFAGHGPRWNSDERVQVYTSPLWFGLLLFARLFTGDLFMAALGLSALCCLATLLVARRLAGHDGRWLVWLMLITGMWSVMDFSSSGLENPLLYLLLAMYAFYYCVWFRATTPAARQTPFVRLMGVCSLLAIARHDSVTLIALPSLYVVVCQWRTAGWRAVFPAMVMAAMPLLGWTLFSLIYYGVPFPNTAYAKMLHGVPRADLIEFGKLYLAVSLKFDVFSLLVLALLLLRLLWRREVAVLFLTLGVLLNLAYVVSVGGDFMQGRFVSEALLLASLALLLPNHLPTAAMPAVDEKWSRVGVAALLVLMLAAASPLKLAPDSGFDINEGRRHYSWKGILNERNFYFKTNSLWAYIHRDKAQPFPYHKWCLMGVKAREQNKQASDFGGIGMYGYCAGLDLIVIDNLALGEPYFARLPKTAGRPWRAGHFHRDAPRGYLESRLSGRNQITDPTLAALWNDMHQLIHEPLFTAVRWRAIWRINTGVYRDIGPVYQADISAQTKAD